MMTLSRLPLLAFVCIAMAIALPIQSVAQLTLYFTDIFKPTLSDGLIGASTMDGTCVTSVASLGGGLRSILVLPDGRLLWSDVKEDRIYVSQLDGSDRETLVSSGLIFPIALAIDPTHSKVYWGDLSAGQIGRVNFDGSQVEIIRTKPAVFAGLAVDSLREKLYWTEVATPASGRIMRSDLDGQNAEVVIAGVGKPSQLVLWGER